MLERRRNKVSELSRHGEKSFSVSFIHMAEPTLHCPRVITHTERSAHQRFFLCWLLLDQEEKLPAVWPVLAGVVVTSQRLPKVAIQYLSHRSAQKKLFDLENKGCRHT